MSKPLSEMTLQELWQLFPVILTEHNDKWADWFDEEKKRLTTLFKVSEAIKISHIGSTAVKGIWAKPTVDILLEIPRTLSMETLKQRLVSGGYICMSEEKNRKSFNRGYTESGFAEKVFHLHLRYFGDNDELYFRDYLIENPSVAKRYEALKLSLWKKYKHDRDGYTNAKGEFIIEHTAAAKEKYSARYK